ncbi:MAG: DUF2235 domain-containing protein [Blastocatellia bacterium]
MAKNVVVCCDGTGNEFGVHNTNVVRLFQIMEKNTDAQVAYYDPGVGTFGAELLGLATGYGITRNIKDAYEYLMNRYEDGDQVFLFGFSRGAYTVRALAGMLFKCGLLPKGSINLIDYAVAIYKGRDNGQIAADFKEAFSRHCPVHFIGVWDTVKALIPFSKIARFHDCRLNHTVKHGYHALAIDERRKPYAPEIWDDSELHEGQTVVQVWFAGVHSDVGGSYLEAGLANITLLWMLENAHRCGLRLRAGEVDKVLPDAADVLHNSRTGGWRFLPARTRQIPDGAKIHRSVFERMENPALNYNPKDRFRNHQVV